MQQFFQVDHLQAVLAHEGGIYLDDVIAQRLHAKGARPADDGFADVADADYTQGAFAEGGAGYFLPFAVFHGPVHPGMAAGKCQHVAQHGIGDGMVKALGVLQT